MLNMLNMFDQIPWKILHRKFTSHFKMSVIEYAKKENIKVTARKYKLLSLLSNLSMFLYIESVNPLSNKSPSSDEDEIINPEGGY